MVIKRDSEHLETIHFTNRLLLTYNKLGAGFLQYWPLHNCFICIDKFVNNFTFYQTILALEFYLNF